MWRGKRKGKRADRNRNKPPGIQTTDSDDIWNTTGRTSPSQRALVDAHFYARVTEATSDLIYQNQSGALNEAFSDIMGNSIEFYAGQGNSGIANHWYYLLVNGGQNAKPARATGQNVTGIGLSAAERIAFLGFTARPANAIFCSARASTAAVAGANAANVRDAWDEVGITAGLCGS